MFDIAAIERSTKRLMKYVDETSEGAMYCKTIQRIKDVIEDLDYVANKLAERIEKNRDGRSAKKVISDVKEQVQAGKPVERPKNSMRKYRISALKDLNRVMHGLNLDRNTTNLKFAQVVDCAQLIQKWYDCRFLNHDPSISSFRYNISSIEKWTQMIIIAYGHNYKNNKSAEFMNKFTRWCNSLMSNNRDCPYPLPWMVFDGANQAVTDKSIENVSGCIWKLLYDLEFNRLSSESNCKLNFSRDSFFDNWEEGIADEKLRRYGSPAYYSVASRCMQFFDRVGGAA